MQIKWSSYVSIKKTFFFEIWWFFFVLNKNSKRSQIFPLGFIFFGKEVTFSGVTSDYVNIPGGTRFLGFINKFFRTFPQGSCFTPKVPVISLSYLCFHLRFLTASVTFKLKVSNDFNQIISIEWNNCAILNLKIKQFWFSFNLVSICFVPNCFVFTIL